MSQCTIFAFYDGCFLHFVIFLLTDVKISMLLHADWIISSTFVVKKVCNILIDRFERLQQHSLYGCVFLRRFVQILRKNG